MEYNCPSLARQRLEYLNGVHKLINIFCIHSQTEQNNMVKMVKEMRNSAREPEPLFIICIRRLVELETHLGNTFGQLRTYENYTTGKNLKRKYQLPLW